MTKEDKTRLSFAALAILALIAELILNHGGYPFTYMAQDAPIPAIAGFNLAVGIILGHCFWGRTKQDRIIGQKIEQYGDPNLQSEMSVRTHAGWLYRVRVPLALPPSKTGTSPGGLRD